VEEAKNKPRWLIRRPVVIDRTGLQTTQIYDLIAEEKFPPPVLRRFDSVYGLKAAHTQSDKSLEDIETERLRKA